MAKLTILGSASAIPAVNHENSHMIIEGKTSAVLIDCPGTPIAQLEQAGIASEKVTDVILTHFHPDHVSGLPTLLMGMWLLGRKKPLTIYGLAYTVERVKAMMDLFDWQSWPDFFQVDFEIIPEKEGVTIIKSDEFDILTSPVNHIMPTIGLRVEFHSSGKVLAYSCDTEPCDAMVKLAHNASLLIHEAAGELYGHSSAFQAGQVAAKANARSLILIHYDVRESPQKFVDEAKRSFDGDVTLAKDFMCVEFS